MINIKFREKSNQNKSICSLKVEQIWCLAPWKKSHYAMTKNQHKLGELHNRDKRFDSFQAMSKTFVRAKEVVWIHDDMDKRINCANINSHLTWKY